MPFMIPIYTNEAFHVGENRCHERECVPASVYGSLRTFIDECGINPGDAEEVTGKWWCRLSAPGYMDATDWSGPHATLADAMRDIRDTFDVHPETGEDLTDDGRDPSTGRFV